ncbi:NUDIX domain-containing protein [Pseudonocardia sp. NPDC046786]|uniref:NUDIX hydrolase n=1 Tax=Pseudonocardia sp. NPDC046786 TaxID=3155471 RepID=UPI0033D1C702
MAETPKHSVSVAGVVVNDANEVLVIQRRDNGRWEPPGGVLELDESPEEGVYREILEETGIKTQVGPLSGIYKNMSRGIIALVFRCEPVAGKEGSTDESRDVKWMSLPDVVDSFSPTYAVRVSDAFEPGVNVRTHDGVRLLEN